MNEPYFVARIVEVRSAIGRLRRLVVTLDHGGRKPVQPLPVSRQPLAEAHGTRLGFDACRSGPIRSPPARGRVRQGRRSARRWRPIPAGTVRIAGRSAAESCRVWGCGARTRRPAPATRPLAPGGRRDATEAAGSATTAVASAESFQAAASVQSPFVGNTASRRPSAALPNAIDPSGIVKICCQN